MSDVDRAKAILYRAVGFTADHDEQISDGFRFVQLTPPGSGCSIALGSRAQRDGAGIHPRACSSSSPTSRPPGRSYSSAASRSARSSTSTGARSSSSAIRTATAGPSSSSRLATDHVTAKAVVLVEGVSDRCCARGARGAPRPGSRSRGRLRRRRSEARKPSDGSWNGTARRDWTSGWPASYDAGEERDFRRGLERAGLGADLTRAEMERLGFFVCVADLEEELIRATGVTSVEGVVEPRETSAPSGASSANLRGEDDRPRSSSAASSAAAAAARSVTRACSSRRSTSRKCRLRPARRPT